MTLYSHRRSLSLEMPGWRNTAGPGPEELLAGQAVVTPGKKSAVFRREGTV
jgi:hypothetical protein